MAFTLIFVNILETNPTNMNIRHDFRSGLTMARYTLGIFVFISSLQFATLSAAHQIQSYKEGCAGLGLLGDAAIRDVGRGMWDVGCTEGCGM